jgi:NAD-dependent dihydropyrimidine dehydrogenase PreA subunit
MLIDQEKCIKCGLCIPYCPMKCIVRTNDGVFINESECVECEICKNAKVCKADALYMMELGWPRIIRNQFSNPLISHPGTGLPGRGTEEMKTNEVTGRFRRGKAGVAIEMGRPGTGTRFRDVEKVAMAIAPLINTFEEHNPVTQLMIDNTGKLDDSILDEKALSAIIEFEIDQANIVPVLEKLLLVQNEIDTLFSLDIACRLEPDGTCPAAILAEEAGFILSLNGKTNVGLGKPLFKEEV